MGKSSLVVALLTGIAAVACAETSSAADDGSLTWNGITLYGVYDIGVAYQTHGTPLSQDWMVGLEYTISKNSNKPITSIAPDGLSQSRIGIKGTEQIVDGLNFVFGAEMAFDPQSGNLAGCPQVSLRHNNGVPLANQILRWRQFPGRPVIQSPNICGLEFARLRDIDAGQAEHATAGLHHRPRFRSSAARTAAVHS